MSDRFYEGLSKVAYDALGAATKALREEQAENARLRKVIAEFPATCWELQERVTMLEQERAARNLSYPAKEAPEGSCH